jgi:hypothetical protein
VLHISEGGEVEFSVHDDGTITVRGYVSIPTDQAWFFALEWLAGEREADQEIAAPDRPFRPDPRVKGGGPPWCVRDDMGQRWSGHLQLRRRARTRRAACHLAADRNPRHLHPAAWSMRHAEALPSKDDDARSLS